MKLSDVAAVMEQKMEEYADVRIARTSWTIGTYVVCCMGRLMLVREYVSQRPGVHRQTSDDWKPTMGDLNADDWSVVWLCPYSTEDKEAINGR